MNTFPQSIKPVRFDEWPRSMKSSWDIAITKGDILEPGSIASDWRPATQRYVINGVSLWLGYLKEIGVPGGVNRLFEHCNRVNVAGFAVRLSDTCAPVTIRQTVLALDRALCVLEPEFDRRFVRQIHAKLPNTPSKVKQESIVDIRVLLDIGIALMNEALNRPLSSFAKTAVKYRDGLIIALLATRPMRRKNLSALELGHAIYKERGIWRIDLPADEVKTHRNLRFKVPKELGPYIETYIERYRPHMLRKAIFDSHSGPLWGSYHGKPVDVHSIALAIRGRTKAALGVALSPHRFRDCAATTTSLGAPSHVKVLPAVLGHSDYKTTEKHYIASQVSAATADYQGLLNDLNKET